MTQQDLLGDILQLPHQLETSLQLALLRGMSAIPLHDLGLGAGCIILLALSDVKRSLKAWRRRIPDRDLARRCLHAGWMGSKMAALLSSVGATVQGWTLRKLFLLAVLLRAET